VAEDLRLVREVMSRLIPRKGPLFGVHDVLDLLGREPWIAELNRHVEQKAA